MDSNITQRPLFPLARRPRQGTPSTVSSAEPLSSRPDNTSQISDECKDDSSNAELMQRFTAVSTGAESSTESSAGSLQESPSIRTSSTYRVPNVNLTLPARTNAELTQRSAAVSPAAESSTESSAGSLQESPSIRASKNVYLTLPAHSNRQTSPIEWVPLPYMRPRMERVADLATDTEEHEAIQRPIQMPLDEMAVSYQSHPTWWTAEEMELMAPITMDDIDKMFDDLDDSNFHQPQKMTSNIAAIAEASVSPAPKRARRARHAATPSLEIGLGRRTRSMTAALSASVSPAKSTRRLRSSNLASSIRTISPSDLAEPASWTSASVADKRLSQMKDAGKGWAEITAMWNKATGKKKSSQEVNKRWKRIEGKIGRWPGFDIALQGTLPNASLGLSAGLWQQIAVAVSTELGFTVSGEESAARFAALQKAGEGA